MRNHRLRWGTNAEITHHCGKGRYPDERTSTNILKVGAAQALVPNNELGHLGEGTARMLTSKKRFTPIRLLFLVVALGVLIVYPLYRFFLNDALCQSSRHGDNAAVEALLQRGANVNGRGWQYITPLLMAVEGRHTDTALLLLDRGANIEDANNLNTPLFWAVEEGDVPMVHALIARHANLNARDADEKTLLQRAQEYKQPEVVEVLKQSGAK